MRRLRGFSLLEVLMSAFLLGILSLVLFELFRAGTGYFRVAVLRQGGQGAARRAILAMERKIQQAYPEATAVLNDVSRTVTVEGVTFHRDALCLPDLSDWGDMARFTPGGLPIWDRYTVLYATAEVPVGRLVLLTIDPGSSAVSGPWAGFTPAFLTTPPPPPGGAVLSSKVLAQDVVDFNVAVDSESFVVTLRLRGKALGPTHGPARVEDFEARMRVKPQNRLP
ncbi:type II secretion system protein [bacterium CPR1]|nr:type II secretion system protein [bacterium CPR1]